MEQSRHVKFKNKRPRDVQFLKIYSTFYGNLKLKTCSEKKMMKPFVLASCTNPLESSRVAGLLFSLKEKRSILPHRFKTLFRCCCSKNKFSRRMSCYFYIKKISTPSHQWPSADFSMSKMCFSLPLTAESIKEKVVGNVILSYFILRFLSIRVIYIDNLYQHTANSSQYVIESISGRWDNGNGSWNRNWTFVFPI